MTPINSFEDGSTNSNGTPVDTAREPRWTSANVENAWSFTVSGRYNRAGIENRGRTNPGGGPGSLDGQYTFSPFNPSSGVTFSPARSVNLYASYAESSRAPTSIELGCADPNNPSNLPNALAGDPPLKPGEACGSASEHMPHNGVHG
jgi:outer membrane receptor protein involved in Fe transport